MNYSSGTLNLLTFGYIREGVKKCKIFQIMPLELYQIIFEFCQFQHISMVLIGHVDAGKSTLAGRLLYDLGIVTPEQHIKIKREATELGKESFQYAFHPDKTKEERARGVTIHGSIKSFSTQSYRYSLLDAPGHMDFTKNVVKLISMADVATLLVPCNRGGFGPYHDYVATLST